MNSTILLLHYRLEPLRQIRQDNIRSFIGDKPGVYICENQPPEWSAHFGLKSAGGVGHTRKKRLMFAQMAAGSVWLNPTSNVPGASPVPSWRNGAVLHLGNRKLPWRFDQILQTATILNWLIRYRNQYHYCLIYNFALPFYLSALTAHLLLRKPLYVDYEDDYTKQSYSLLKVISEKLLRRTATGAICCHEQMTTYFPTQKTVVLNAFADLSYTKSANFEIQDGIRFLYSGTLDSIRGVELIPELVLSLRQRLRHFRILITGKGPLEGLVRSWTHPEIEYLGFLDPDDYAATICQADACLILQKPDHRFSEGSFPSKVEEYASYKKPIYVIR